MKKPLQTDEHGHVIVKPVLGWSTHLARAGVLLSIEYLKIDEGLNTGRSQTVQLGLTAEMCDDLAAALSKAASGILEEARRPETSVH